MAWVSFLRTESHAPPRRAIDARAVAVRVLRDVEASIEGTLTGVVRQLRGSVSRRARLDRRLRQPTSSKWVEVEDTATPRRFHRIVEIDTVNDADEPDTEWDASRERTEDVAEVPNALRRVQLGRSYFFCPAAHRDGRAAGSAQVAHPLDLAPRGPDPTPA